tara:strand:- start:200 stop:469 length:270 start_codon:yes stop_codon:yes gene_type:complete
MNKIILILSFFLIILLYKFTQSDTSYFKYNQLKSEVIKLEEENIKFIENIKVLKAEIEDLKTGLSVIEEKARNELGLIKEKETFFQILK